VLELADPLRASVLYLNAPIGMFFHDEQRKYCGWGANSLCSSNESLRTAGPVREKGRGKMAWMTLGQEQPVEFWASPDRFRIWGEPMDLVSEVERSFDQHKREIFEQVMRIDGA